VPYVERPAFRVPVLGIRGGDDDLATEADLQALARFVPAELLTLRVFPGRKHDLHLYKTHEDVFQCIAEFMTPDRRST
jgi:alpha-beta hydrolase superfamily lysophospholipase